MFRSCHLRKLKTQNSPEFLSISAQEKLEGQLDPRHNIKDFAVLFSLYTGVRIGECCAVKWKNIHFEDSELLITHTLQRVRTYSGNSKTCLQYSEPKSQCAVRRIPLTGTLMELLKGMRQSVHGTAEEFVFRSHAHVLEPRALQHHIKNWLRRAELPTCIFIRCVTALPPDVWKIILI